MNDRRRRMLLIGTDRLADNTERALVAGGAYVERLQEANDEEIRTALERDVDSVVVISRTDVVSLRLALVVAHVRPGIPLLVSLFNPHVAGELRRIVENVQVLSMADIVAPSFAGPALNPDLLSVADAPSKGTAGVIATDGVPGPVSEAWHAPGRGRRILARLGSAVMPFDPSARILVAGVAGFAAVFFLETLVTILARDLSLVEAFYTVAKVTVTVGPSQAAETGPGWFKVFSAVSMLFTLGFAAVLTAGLVNRLLDARLTGIVGASAVPRREHVVVVGMGQVGLRLCGLLRDLGIPVVAVETDSSVAGVAEARAQKFPVVIGSGRSHDVLERLSIRRARALAAVTSDEVENIAVAVAARSIRKDLPVVLRAGDGDVATDPRALFEIGVVRDVYRIAGTALAAAALGYRTRTAFPYEGTLYLVDDEGEIGPFVPVHGDGEVSAPAGHSQSA